MITEIINEENFSIIDSYLANNEIYDYISKYSKKCLYIDDNQRINYPKGMVVNPSIYGEYLLYDQSEENEYLLGSKYIILREPFLMAGERVIRKEVGEILLTLGGSDIRNLNFTILDLLMAHYPNVDINIVMGKGSRNIDRIIRIEDPHLQFFYDVDAYKMKELMEKSDFAITATGQTTYELIKTKTPFIPIHVIDNQTNNVKGLIKYNLVNNVIWSGSNNLSDILINEINFLMDVRNRVMLIENFDNIIDGNGSVRIISKFLGENKVGD